MFLKIENGPHTNLPLTYQQARMEMDDLVASGMSPQDAYRHLRTNYFFYTEDDMIDVDSNPHRHVEELVENEVFSDRSKAAEFVIDQIIEFSKEQ